MQVHVVLGISKEKLPGTTVVVDILRSSSTIVAALANGAEVVIPFTNIEEMLRFCKVKMNRSDVVLVGERHGIMPRRFDRNISPLEMTKENVGGRTVLYSSTNFTRVLRNIRHGHRIIVGSINNAEATADYLKSIGRDATIVACGAIDGVRIEDVAGAGAIANSMTSESLSDSARVALGLYRNSECWSLVREGRTARQLCDLGFEKDIDYCLSPNTSSVVPVLIGKRIVRVTSALDH